MGRGISAIRCRPSLEPLEPEGARAGAPLRRQSLRPFDDHHGIGLEHLLEAERAELMRLESMEVEMQQPAARPVMLPHQSEARRLHLARLDAEPARDPLRQHRLAARHRAEEQASPARRELRREALAERARLFLVRGDPVAAHRAAPAAPSRRGRGGGSSPATSSATSARPTGWASPRRGGAGVRARARIASRQLLGEIARPPAHPRRGSPRSGRRRGRAGRRRSWRRRAAAVRAPARRRPRR